MPQPPRSDDECRMLGALLDPSLKPADRTVEVLADRLQAKNSLDRHATYAVGGLRGRMN